MTRRRRPSRFRDRAATGRGRRARARRRRRRVPAAAAAQACCVGTGLVTPAPAADVRGSRVGIQMRARSVMGAFGPTGSYAASAAGTRELDSRKTCSARSASARASGRASRRRSSRRRAPFRRVGFRGWPGRHRGQRALRPHERGQARPLAGPRDPGRALRPDGTPPDEADDPLATSGTGTGSYEGKPGVAVEEIIGRASCRCRLRVEADRRAPPTASSSRSPHGCRRCCRRIHVRARHHRRRVRVGCCVKATPRRGGAIANSSVALVTAGAALALPFWDVAPADDRCSPTSRSPAGGATRPSDSAARSPSSASGSKRRERKSARGYG